MIIGFPFERSEANVTPIWKRALVSSEPAYLSGGKLQVLLDSPGRPGMSGSPVFLNSTGFSVTGEQIEMMEAKDHGKLLDSLTMEQMQDRTVVLEFVGIYAGTYGEPALRDLNLGRMIPGVLLDAMLDRETRKVRRGTNPYPPETI